jgi:arylsulfatase A-like enzyme
LALLKELGLDEHTLVMTSGDNGSSFAPNSEIGKLFDQAANGLRGYKRGLYEGALRQAALARWPGRIPAGRVSDEPWASWDFLPTALEFSGTPAPAGLKTDGLSLASFLQGGAAPKRDYFYWELHEGQSLQAARWGDWKAVRNGPAAKVEVYDLKTDSAEKMDLATQRPELVAKALAIFKDAHVDHPEWPMRTQKQANEANKARGKESK